MLFMPGAGPGGRGHVVVVSVRRDHDAVDHLRSGQRLSRGSATPPGHVQHHVSQAGNAITSCEFKLR